MRLGTFICGAALVTMVASVACGTARANSYSAVIVYGDSLSDNGNLYRLDGGIDPLSPPYYQGRFSNGPVAVEQLAAGAGLPLYDYAVAGATTGLGNEGDGGTTSTLGVFGLPGMQLEVAASAPLVASPITSSALFVVWGGANDLLAGGSPITAAADVDGIVATLEGDGARHILVPNLPDLGLTPDYLGVPAATTYSLEFNASLLAGLPGGATYVNTYALLNAIEADPSAYGITDTTQPCLVGVTVCANPSQYLFWDGFHPTTTVDTLVAGDLLSVAGVPEPPSGVMMGTGVLGLALVMGKRRGLLRAGV